MVRIPGVHCCGPGSVPGQGTEIQPAVWLGQKKKKKKICQLFDPKIPVTEIHSNKTQRSGDATAVHCNTVYKSEHLETTYMSAIRSWLRRPLNRVYGILFSYWNCMCVENSLIWDNKVRLKICILKFNSSYLLISWIRDGFIFLIFIWLHLVCTCNIQDL